MMIRYLKNEVEELQELEKEKQKYYASENKEMDEFKEQVGNFVVECQVQIEELRSHANEVSQLCFMPFLCLLLFINFTHQLNNVYVLCKS